MLSKRLLGLDSLRGTLRLYAVVLVFLPLALSLAFFSLFERARLLDSQKETMREALRLEKAVILDAFENIFRDLSLVAVLGNERGFEPEALRKLFASYKMTHPTIPDMVFANAAGKVVTIPENPNIFIGDRGYFAKARQGHRAISDLLISRRTGTELVTLSVPATDADGRFAGVVFVPFELSSLDDLLGKAPVGEDGLVSLTDASGRVLAPISALAAQAREAEPGALNRRLIAAGAAGALVGVPEGQGMLGVAVPLIGERWYLVGRRPVGAVLAGYYRQIGMMTLGALASILLVTPLLVRLAGRLERPLAQLLRFSRELRSNQAKIEPEARADPSMPVEMRALYQAFVDMAREVRAHIEEAERLSVQDHLTGLYNRRFLYDGGAKLLLAAARAGRPCACLMIDVDHFKRVNDTYGHTVGDRVLAHVAGIIAGGVRKADLVARYGGEEFAVLLTGADREQGALLAERLRGALAGRPCVVDGKELPVTVSIGVSRVRPEVVYGGSVLDDLLARADRAMYAAKDAGRDRVEVDAA